MLNRQASLGPKSQHNQKRRSDLDRLAPVAMGRADDFAISSLWFPDSSNAANELDVGTTNIKEALSAQMLHGLAAEPAAATAACNEGSLPLSV